VEHLTQHSGLDQPAYGVEQRVVALHEVGNEQTVLLPGCGDLSPVAGWDGYESTAEREASARSAEVMAQPDTKKVGDCLSLDFGPRAQRFGISEAGGGVQEKSAPAISLGSGRDEGREESAFLFVRRQAGADAVLVLVSGISKLTERDEQRSCGPKHRTRIPADAAGGSLFWSSWRCRTGWRRPFPAVASLVTAAPPPALPRIIHAQRGSGVLARLTRIMQTLGQQQLVEEQNAIDNHDLC
jgi:hypothetical protein